MKKLTILTLLTLSTMAGAAQAERSFQDMGNEELKWACAYDFNLACEELKARGVHGYN